MLGIDPSLTATGIACCDGTLLVSGGASILGDRRLTLIHKSIMKACEDGPVLAVVEDLPTHAMGAGKSGMAQGVVRLALLANGVPYAEIVPATLKKYATGHGRAGKPAMRAALFEHTGVDERSTDKVDAAWLRHAGLDWLGAPEIVLPANQRAALDKAKWPEEYRK